MMPGLKNNIFVRPSHCQSDPPDDKLQTVFNSDAKIQLNNYFLIIVRTCLFLTFCDPIFCILSSIG